MRVMNKVASGTELAVFVLMVIPAHLLPQQWLVLHQLLHSVGEEAKVYAKDARRVSLVLNVCELQEKPTQFFVIFLRLIILLFLMLLKKHGLFFKSAFEEFS